VQFLRYSFRTLPEDIVDWKGKGETSEERREEEEALLNLGSPLNSRRTAGEKGCLVVNDEIRQVGPSTETASWGGSGLIPASPLPIEGASVQKKPLYLSASAEGSC